VVLVVLVVAVVLAATEVVDFVDEGHSHQNLQMVEQSYSFDVRNYLDGGDFGDAVAAGDVAVVGGAVAGDVAVAGAVVGGVGVDYHLFFVFYSAYLNRLQTLLFDVFFWP